MQSDGRSDVYFNVDKVKMERHQTSQKYRQFTLVYSLRRTRPTFIRITGLEPSKYPTKGCAQVLEWQGCILYKINPKCHSVEHLKNPNFDKLLIFIVISNLFVPVSQSKLFYFLFLFFSEFTMETNIFSKQHLGTKCYLKYYL